MSTSCIPFATAYLGQVLGVKTNTGCQAAVSLLATLLWSYVQPWGATLSDLIARLTKHVET